METKLITLSNVTAQEVIENFQKSFQPDVHVDCSNSGNLVHIFVFEEYFMRIESNLACTIIFNQGQTGSLDISIIVAGGSHGFFGITWGAETSTLNRVKGFLDKYQK